MTRSRKGCTSWWSVILTPTAPPAPRSACWPCALGYGNVSYLVPNRFEDGYGLSPEVVDQAHARGAQMIMTVDNGISSHAGVDHAHALGIPVLVTDHHLPGEMLPAAEAIVNPNLRDCDFPSKSLAGVGWRFI